MARKLCMALAATLALSVLGIPMLAVPAGAAASLPSGFVQTVRFSGQTSEALTAFALLPDGGMLTAGKGGNVTWVAPDDSAFRKIAQLPARNRTDLGLVGLALAPEYAMSGALFTAYAYSDSQGNGFHRLSEWRVDDPSRPTALRNERVILDRITVGPSNVHGATDVVVGPDGTLWLSIGDGAIGEYVDPLALQALDLDDPHGKVLHIQRDGTGVADNPYYNPAAPSSWRSRVYASGFRSPFRFTLDPRTGGPVLADVGWNVYEEINVLRPGGSYGWPCWEGPERTPGYKDLPGCAGVGHTAPAYSYSRSEGVSVTGGVFYDGDLWPEQYRGAYLFGDYGSKRLWTARIDAGGRIAKAPVPFGSGIGGPVHFRTAPNGDVMYADIYNGNVVRLSYAPGNRRPTPLVTTTTEPATRTVHFDASASSDLDGDALEWSWNFGDPGSTMNTATGPEVPHTYSPGETFTARLTLSDGIGEPVVHDIVVWPSNHEPVLSVVEGTGTGPDGTFTVGDPVQLSATATDAEDGDLEITWTSALVHCRGTLCHDHEPKTTAGPSFSTDFGDHGGDTRLVIRATAKDSKGATSAHQFVARPSLRRLTVQTNTPALVTINGVDGLDAVVTEGSTNSVTVPVSATDGVASFSAWGDGVTGRIRQVVMGSADVVLTATYATPIERRYTDDAALRWMVGTPLGPEQGSAVLRWRDYERGRVYWTPTTGARVLIGAIKATFLQLGGHVTQGVPLNDERTTPDGIGRYNHFSTGVSIYWTPQTGAHAVGGAIRQRWQALGWEAGPMGYPVTSETGTPDGIGRYNHFSKGGSIYWTPQTGAHGAWGAIRQRWAALGWERGYLGYPRTSEYSIPGGRRNNFQRGYVTWTARTGWVVDRRY